MTNFLAISAAISYTKRLWFISIILLLSLRLSVAQNPHKTLPVPIKTGHFKDINLESHLQVFCDSSNQAFLEKIKNNSDNKFKALASYTQGLNPDYTYWVKFKLHNTSKQFIRSYLRLGTNDTVHIFVSAPNQTNIQTRQATGIMVDFKNRVHSTGPWYEQLAQLNLAPQSTHTIYYQIRNFKSQPINLQTILVSDRKQQAHMGIQDFTQGIFHGFFWLTFFIAITLFISTKKNVYLLYALQTIGFSIAYLPSYGYMEFITHNNFQDYIIWLIASQLASASYIQFMRVAVHTREMSRYLDYALIFLIGIRLLVIVVGIILLFGYNHTLPTILASMANFVSLALGTIAIVYAYGKGNAFAKYLLAGCVMFLAGVTLNTLASQGVITAEVPGVFLQTGLLLQNIVFGAGLGHNIYLNFKREQKAQIKILSLEKNAKKELEVKVKERTKELKSANDSILSQNEELQQQQEEILAQQDFIETKNKELARAHQQLASSIRAAENIQKAILPQQSKFEQLLKDYFIIYRPKDVVSGDFYWITEIKTPTHKNQYPKPANASVLEETTQVVLAAVDCTGHGVPGAFMSLIGHMLLDKIVNILKITDPAKILKQLDKEVKQVIKQNGVRNDGGMDMSLVVLEKLPDGRTKVDFAGAKNSLTYIPSNDLGIKEIRGTRKSIGKQTRMNTNFETKRLILPPESLLYLRSDGFTDQNNVRRRKLGSDKLNQTLEKNQHLNLKNQQLYLSALLDHYMIDTEQRDDILLIGVQV